MTIHLEDCNPGTLLRAMVSRVFLGGWVGGERLSHKHRVAIITLLLVSSEAGIPKTCTIDHIVCRNDLPWPKAPEKQTLVK